MDFLIDSNLWIAIERGRISAADIYAITGSGGIFVSPVNLAEIRFGIELIQDAAQRNRALRMLRRMQRKPLLRITGQTADVFGRIAAALSQSGRGHEFRIQDIWLAAQAIERNCTLLTANAKDFQDVPDLNLVPVKLPKS
ncbi:MAG TPA: PIN domain-containing protein [Verrucomicrobiae bacterium]|nr:PIN domain-containing protein [Verrucomicrobiae bacterium]